MESFVREHLNWLKTLGVKFDEDNLKSCLDNHLRREKVCTAILKAKELGISLEDELNRTVVAAMILSNSEHKCFVSALDETKNIPPLFIEAVKSTDVYSEILYVLEQQSWCESELIPLP
ncbi:hypothetical protein C942_04515 [Photobacterium marinum]|uniref:Uncharacterized protein n=1 Tax=Photobacterium marinum TaxID=1056511 RepID=L8JDA3_9GAMM|nr:hypothetical protein [Photobacterium marinum]ELR66816.1 hypothetical protein C942_04515 [Photobacterium marinum]